MTNPNAPAPSSADPEALLAAARTRTPARVLAGRSGASYRTATQLELRLDHAAAVDAVQAEIDLTRDLGPDFVRQWGLIEVETQARDKAEYLARPDLGRLFMAQATQALEPLPKQVDLQVAVGDGLSAAAVVAQLPALLPALATGAERLGWRFGRPFFIRHCRVGILNEIGARLDPAVVVLLIGERPGLATAESLSAYLAYRPRPGHTDADRNLISNIHARGTPVAEAADRILALADQLIQTTRSGIAVKEGSPATPHLPPGSTPPLRSTDRDGTRG